MSPESFEELIAAFDDAHHDPLKQAELIQRAAQLAQSESDDSRRQIKEFEVATRYQGLKERTGYPGP